MLWNVLRCFRKMLVIPRLLTRWAASCRGEVEWGRAQRPGGEAKRGSLCNETLRLWQKDLWHWVQPFISKKLNNSWLVLKQSWRQGIFSACGAVRRLPSPRGTSFIVRIERDGLLSGSCWQMYSDRMGNQRSEESVRTGVIGHGCFSNNARKLGPVDIEFLVRVQVCFLILCINTSSLQGRRKV